MTVLWLFLGLLWALFTIYAERWTQWDKPQENADKGCFWYVWLPWYGNYFDGDS